MSESLPEVYLARHGETAWTVTGQHTGRSNIPLTARGERNARNLADRLRGITFENVFVSPLARARRTCDLADFGATAAIDPNLAEWDYGEYEGRTTAEIRATNPHWNLFSDGCPGGELAEAIGARADRVVIRARRLRGRVLLFGHGDFFRVLAARWLGLPIPSARYFLLSTASLSVLSYWHTIDEPALRLWNDDRHVNRQAV